MNITPKPSKTDPQINEAGQTFLIEILVFNFKASLKNLSNWIADLAAGTQALK